MEDASPEAVLAIGNELLSREGTPKVQRNDQQLIDALGSIATPPARRVLRLVENGTLATRRSQASKTLDEIRGSSPAGPMHQVAGTLVDEGKLDEAEAMFAKALEMDPELAEIYVSRGHMKGRDKRRAEAVKDYDKALEIDPLHPIATSLKAICIVVLGDVEGGLQMVEDNRKTFQYDSLFNYNAACAYGQAVIVTPPTPENLEKIAQWKLKGLEYLEHYANDLTPLQDDGELIRDDPDLAPLRELPRFRKVLESRKKFKSKDRDDEG
jgi:tetratricopeptide (TPR) repeat protein